MYILSLEAINYKSLRSFLLDADGNNIEISGDTGSGKTTAASILWHIITKGKDVLTHGEKKGILRAAIGDETGVYYKAERVITPSKDTVTFSKMLGKKALPMDLNDFDAMLSKLSVNPHKITQMKSAERIKTLLAAADSDVDLEALDAQIEDAETDRLVQGRAAKASKPVEVPEKTEPVSVSELISQRDAAQSKNLFILGKRQELDVLDKEQEVDAKALEDAMQLVSDLEDSLDSRRFRIEKGRQWSANQSLATIDTLDLQISCSEKTNALAAVYTQAVKDLENHNLLQSMHKKSYDMVKDLREQKKKALDAVKWPLDGIAVEDGAIAYNGVLLENLGESEQMLVTAAIALGDIEKHEIRVVRMDGVESLSKADYATMRDLFNARGVQVLSTRVSRNNDAEPNEITIVNGNYSDEN